MLQNTNPYYFRISDEEIFLFLREFLVKFYSRGKNFQNLSKIVLYFCSGLCKQNSLYINVFYEQIIGILFKLYPAQLFNIVFHSQTKFNIETQFLFFELIYQTKMKAIFIIEILRSEWSYFCVDQSRTYFISIPSVLMVNNNYILLSKVSSLDIDRNFKSKSLISKIFERDFVQRAFLIILTRSEKKWVRVDLEDL